jgi:hypothetical protein
VPVNANGHCPGTRALYNKVNNNEVPG